MIMLENIKWKLTDNAGFVIICEIILIVYTGALYDILTKP